MTDQPEEKLQESLDQAYIKGKLPKRQKVEKETQTIFKIRQDD